MERQPEAIAMTKAIDSGVWKWVVGWNSSTRCDPQDFSLQRSRILCGRLILGISMKNIEHAIIRAELDDSAVVINCGLEIVEDDNWQGVGGDGIPTRHHGRKPSDAIERVARTVGHI